MTTAKNPLVQTFRDGSVLSATAIREAAKAHRLYVLFILPRTGSTWLTELARGTKVLGTPQEWFNEEWIQTSEPALGCLPPKARGTLNINDYVESIVDDAVEAVGVELTINQVRLVHDLIEGAIDVKEVTWFYLRRRDLVSQAISLYRSAASGLFHSYQDIAFAERLNEVKFDGPGILRSMSFLVDCEVLFEDFFKECRILPCPLFYEDLIADPLVFLQLMAKTIGCSVPTRLPSTTLQVLRNSRSVEWGNAIEQSHALDLREILLRRPRLNAGPMLSPGNHGRLD